MHSNFFRHICHYLNFNIITKFGWYSAFFHLFKKSVHNRGNYDFELCKEFDVFYCDIKIGSENLFSEPVSHSYFTLHNPIMNNTPGNKSTFV